MKKKIFGADLYVTFEGTIEDSQGNQVVTKKKEGGNYFVNIGKNKYRSVPKLVAEAFIGPYKGSYAIIHLDGDKSNNAAYNLEYSKNNNLGVIANRWALYNSIPKDRINLILSKLEDGEAIDDIAKKFKFPTSMILYIISKNNENNAKKA